MGNTLSVYGGTSLGVLLSVINHCTELPESQTELTPFKNLSFTALKTTVLT